tara:strand:+ start:190 stop:552 length:363 start_codon:yes stop_codon:yes gene_type:complete
MARHLEAHGIPAVVLGSAHDIVTHCGVPRFCFTDLPLGNPCGKPWDTAMQRDVVASALDLFERAERPRTIAQSPHAWGDDAWRARYLEIRDKDRTALLAKGEARRAERAALRASGQVRKE